tara:strand:- start:1038 stop:1901 length:864 start_codon:yes stop_codon:yes gene_type:complete
MNTESPEFHSLKAGIRPENLRIRSGREVRVELSISENQLIDFLAEIGEVWIHTFTNGAKLKRRLVLNEIENVWRHADVLAEVAGVLYDWRKWRNLWAVQRNEATGGKSFFLDVAGPEGLAHQIFLTARTRFEIFQRLVAQCQTGDASDTYEYEASGFLEFIENRRRNTLSKMRMARRVDRAAVPNFIQCLTVNNETLRITMLNAVVKQTVECCFPICRVQGTEIMLSHADYSIEWDNACVSEAWMVQCGCVCGKEVLELYDPQKRLIASVALPQLPPAISNLIPTLN